MMTSKQGARRKAVRTIAKKPQTRTLSVSVNPATNSVITPNLVMVSTVPLSEFSFHASDYLLFRKTMFVLSGSYD